MSPTSPSCRPAFDGVEKIDHRTRRLVLCEGGVPIVAIVATIFGVLGTVLLGMGATLQN
jgi:hypothetical protein